VNVEFSPGCRLELAEHACHVLIQLVPAHLVGVCLAVVDVADDLADGPRGRTACCFGLRALSQQEDQ
jgi:hypothetical protein